MFSQERKLSCIHYIHLLLKSHLFIFSHSMWSILAFIFFSQDSQNHSFGFRLFLRILSGFDTPGTLSIWMLVIENLRQIAVPSSTSTFQSSFQKNQYESWILWLRDFLMVMSFRKNYSFICSLSYLLIILINQYLFSLDYIVVTTKYITKISLRFWS